MKDNEVQPSGSKMSLERFLKLHKKQQGQSHTHTWFAAGHDRDRPVTLYIPPAEVPWLSQLLVEHDELYQRTGKGVNSISEKLVRDTPFRFVVDIDFKASFIKTWAVSSGVATDQLLETLTDKLRSLCMLCHTCVAEVTSLDVCDIKMIVTTRLPYKIHLHFPSVIVTSKLAKDIVAYFDHRYKEQHADLYASEVVDSSIYTSGLRLLYCHKGSMTKSEKRAEELQAHESLFGKGTYSDIYYITNVDDWVQTRAPRIEDLSRTALNAQGESLSSIITNRAGRDKGKGKAKGPVRALTAGFDKQLSAVDEELSSFLRDAFTLSAEELRTADAIVKGDTLVIPTRSKACPFVKREHKNNQVYIVVSAAAAELRCHDQGCYNKRLKVPRTVREDGSALDVVRSPVTDEKRKDFIVKNMETIQARYPLMNIDVEHDDIQPSALVEETGYLVPLRNNRFCGVCGKEHDSPQNCLMVLLREQRLLCRETMNFDRFPMGEDYTQVIFANVVNNQVNISINNAGDTVESRDFGSFEGFPRLHDDPELNYYCYLSLSGRTCDVAEYVTRLMKGQYIYHEKTWYHFTGKYWRHSGGPHKLMSKDMIAVYKGLQRVYSGEKHRKWLLALEDDMGNINRRKAYLEDLEQLEAERDEVVPLEKNAHLIGFQNGVFDSRDCTFRPHRADDYLTMLAPYDLPDADPIVREHIETMLTDILPDEKVRDFVLLVLCLHLEGQNRHDIAMIWTGVGGNGKGLLKSLMKETFGGFHKEPPATFLTNERPSSDRPCADLIDLQYTRSVFTSEPQAGKKTNSGFLKFITGRDSVRVRNVHSSSYIEFVPRFIVTLLCNTIPLFEGGEEDIRGIWRRVKIVHFGSIFKDNPDPTKPNEKQKDPLLEERVKNWGPQFMTMLMERFRQYVDGGRKIYVPENVERNLTDQKEENSPFDSWLTDNLEQTPGKVHLHRFEKAYNAANRDKPKITSTTVINQLTARGFFVSRSTDKVRDTGCCSKTPLRWVQGANVKDWETLNLKT